MSPRCHPPAGSGLGGSVFGMRAGIFFPAIQAEVERNWGCLSASASRPRNAVVSWVQGKLNSRGKITPLSRITVLEFRLGIGIVPGLRNAPGFPTLCALDGLERAGNGEAEDGAGRFVQCWSALREFHVRWHRGCSIKFSMFQLNDFTLKPSTRIPLSFLPLVLCLVFPPWDHPPAFSRSCFLSLAHWAGLRGARGHLGESQEAF